MTDRPTLLEALDEAWPGIARIGLDAIAECHALGHPAWVENKATGRIVRLHPDGSRTFIDDEHVAARLDQPLDGVTNPEPALPPPGPEPSIQVPGPTAEVHQSRWPRLAVLLLLATSAIGSASQTSPAIAEEAPVTQCFGMGHPGFPPGRAIGETFHLPDAQLAMEPNGPYGARTVAEDEITSLEVMRSTCGVFLEGWV